ncbi:formate--tetrahydrofolate ligase [Brevifollis gellanilyticus]|uniref:Formate--tetrahydrofolate ligase n=1 Tax=Brevifollis gellanilyticus TaxID=748831 RepID=A0A512M584_9BACT|nr:formate--tetrahydrofolate ligase [Brevifollis gellanilyticus]GEP41521.1 formate--tetrahydrofolate ligase [Brevifollis gellanilyticus]
MLSDIASVAHSLSISNDHLSLYGTDKAKVSLKALKDHPQRGKLILVSAITPTPAGEGKTTVSIGLAQGLKKIGQNVALALRQPSMGPVFGRKGGATGGGKSTVQPAQSINLHFTGDFHAITSAHNLLSSVLDNQLFNQQTRLSPNGLLWKRVMDVNDRALRRIRTGMGAATERASGFDITAASEVMAILCLSESLADLRARLDRIVTGFTPEGEPVLAKEARVTGALLALLRDALQPNLVQSVEGVPAFLHGGPFANIAHGCNSVLATRMALTHADYVVTEAGFAFDLGGEKFMHIKCRQSGLQPEAIVIVATVRALKMHGGVALDALTHPDPESLKLGLENLAAHLDSAQQFGRPVIVAINQFTNDSPEELALIHDYCQSRGVPCATANVFGEGGAGATKLAETVLAALPKGPADPLPFLYQPHESVEQKLHAIATHIYGADGVTLTEEAKAKFALFEKSGFGHLPLCMAKTQNSLSDDGTKLGRPRGFTITVRDFEIANGAGFLVALTGTMMRMPALPKVPAAERIQVSEDGVISGV